MKFSFVQGRMRVLLRRQAPIRSGVAARTVLHPNPRSSPAHQPVVRVAQDAGTGDVLMLTPGLRELKRVNPASQINLHAKFPDLVDGLPCIDTAWLMSTVGKRYPA